MCTVSVVKVFRKLSQWNALIRVCSFLPGNTFRPHLMASVSLENTLFSRGYQLIYKTHICFVLHQCRVYHVNRNLMTKHNDLGMDKPTHTHICTHTPSPLFWPAQFAACDRSFYQLDHMTFI